MCAHKEDFCKLMSLRHLSKKERDWWARYFREQRAHDRKTALAIWKILCAAQQMMELHQRSHR